MAQQIRVGTQFHRTGTTPNPMDNTYIVEKISSTTVAGTKTYRIEVRTMRQRCFDRALTGCTVWTDAQVRDDIAAGTLRIEEQK